MADTTTTTSTTAKKPVARKRAARKPAAAKRRPAPVQRSLVERAALTYMGATLEARDRVLGVVETVTNRTATERELKKLQARYERRGTTSRNRIERDVKKARTRIERAVRRNRGDVGGQFAKVEEAAKRFGVKAKDRVTALV